MKNILMTTDLMMHLLLRNKGRGGRGSIIRLQVIKFENG